MLDFGFYNMDCMEGMKQFPDKYFDLAVVDPPYGDGSGNDGGYWNRFGERFDKYKNSSGGWHGKQKYHLGTYSAEERQKTGRDVGLCELAEHGRRNSQKNHYVGCCPGKRIFHRAFSHLTESNNLGR